MSPPCGHSPRVLLVHCAPEWRSRLSTEAARHARALGGGLAGCPHGGHFVLLVPSEDPGSLAAFLAMDLGQALGTPVTVGSAGPATAPERLPTTYAEAGRCLEALHTLGRTGDGAALPDLGFVGVLLGARADIHGYVRDVLGPVLDYDTERGTELVHTLDAPDTRRSGSEGLA